MFPSLSRKLEVIIAKSWTRISAAIPTSICTAPNTELNLELSSNIAASPMTSWAVVVNSRLPAAAIEPPLSIIVSPGLMGSSRVLPARFVKTPLKSIVIRP